MPVANSYKRYRGRFLWVRIRGNEHFEECPPCVTPPDCTTCPGLCCRIFVVRDEKGTALPGTEEAGNWIEHYSRKRHETNPRFRTKEPAGCIYLKEGCCSDYTNRPSMCVAFAPGSHNCEAIRYYYGFSVSKHFLKELRKRASRACVKAVYSDENNIEGILTC